MEYAFNIYYWYLLCSLLFQDYTNLVRGSNIGAQSRLAATFIEKYRGFWAAYLMSLSSVALGFTLLWLSGKKLS